MRTEMETVLAKIQGQQTRGPRRKPSSWKHLAKWAAFEVTHEQQKEILHDVAQFALDCQDERDPYWLSIFGRSGNGKTHLARRVYRAAFRHRIAFDALWVDWQGLISATRQGDYSALSDIRKADLVVIDDYGSTVDKNSRGAELFAEIQQTRLYKWTCLTSNYEWADFARENYRTASRLKEGDNVVWQCAWDDYRLTKRQNNEQQTNA